MTALMIRWETLSPELKLAVRVRMARAAAQLTQEQLGAQVGELLNCPPYSQKQVWNWERNGNVPSCAIGAIAKATGFRIDFFNVIS